MRESWRGLLRHPAAPVVAGVVVGAAFRLWVGARYAGWEESDYGNLAMIRGVLDGGFLHYDMNHMPGYYAMGAAVLAVVGDAVVAGRVVSGVGGLVALAVGVVLARRMGGLTAAWLTAALLAVQPEFALYSASQLREPAYIGAVALAVWSLTERRLARAGAFAALAFTVRMDAAVALAPVLLVHALDGGPGRLGRALRLFGPLSATVLAWAAYCAYEHGTPVFFGHSVQVNLDTGLGAEHSSPLAWLHNGLRIQAGLLAGMLPARVGWFIWGGALAGAVLAPPVRDSVPRTVTLAAGGLLAVWSGIGLVAQHEPTHNLYWKWMMPSVAFVVPLGVTGLLAALARLPVAALRPAVLVLGLVQALVAYRAEGERQIALSAALYGPQRRLGEWIERYVPPETPLLIDNIPRCWVDRVPHAREIHNWFDLPLPDGDPAAFGAHLQAHRIAWVLWFAEDWTQAPRFAPFLAAGGTVSVGPVRLREAAREDGYGWILYAVEGAAAPTVLDAPDPGDYVRGALGG